VRFIEQTLAEVAIVEHRIAKIDRFRRQGTEKGTIIVMHAVRRRNF